jgi:23S rRNA (pseudouridine1915-N3)-methyltransferase
MRVLLAAIGRLKDAERALFARYWERLKAQGRCVGIGPLAVQEIGESRAQTSALCKSDEAARLLKVAQTADVVVALDERGSAMTSLAFARYIAKTRDTGAKSMGFLLGGPDGHGEAALQAATLKLSLGPMTLPHGLARIVLAEQLYRTAMILSGHPYHRF